MPDETLQLIGSLPGEISRADERIRPTVVETPLRPWAQLSEGTGGPVLVKQENLQMTGSFKLRGATNAIALADPAQGVVTASSGNHGAGIAHALTALGRKGVIFLPQTVEASKLAALQRTGHELRLIGSESGETEAAARDFADSQGWCYVSPYNDAAVIAGQGTVGSEILRQSADVDVLYVAVGGGGLISGIAAAVKAVGPHVRIIGCSPANSCAMHLAAQAGHVVDASNLPTFSDGTAGGIEEEAITIGLCRALVDGWVTVSESEIAAAVRDYIDDCHQLVEGASGVAFAGLRKHAAEGGGPPLTRIAVSCGANVGQARLAEMLNARP